MEHPLASYQARSGRLEAVWTIEIQTPPDDVDRILDAVVEVHHLRYGAYERNASVSAPGPRDRPPARRLDHRAPRSENPNRWWNNGRGLPDRIASITDHLAAR